jgi:sulfur-carrier protein
VRVEVRLYAIFANLAPTQRAGDPFDVDLESGDSLTDLIGKLGIPEDDVHLAIVNGRPVHDRSQQLQHNDRIGLFPPVGGG